MDDPEKLAAAVENYHVVCPEEVLGEEGEELVGKRGTHVHQTV